MAMEREDRKSDDGRSRSIGGIHGEDGDDGDRFGTRDSGGARETEIVERVARLVRRSKSLQDASSAFSSRLRTEEQRLSQEAVDLEKEIQALRADLSSAAADGKEIAPPSVEKLEGDLYKSHCMISEGYVGSLLPHKSNGLFLRLLLGPVDVRVPQDDGRLRVKEEYNSYRDTTAIQFLLIPSILLFLRNFVWNGCFPALIVQMYQAWLLFFYTSLALRENILRVNGSDIWPWWVYHHYCAMLIALVCLTWDFKGHLSCEKKQHGIWLFLVWAVMQGIAMLLQNRYQRQRLYTRIALGKGSKITYRSSQPFHLLSTLVISTTPTSYLQAGRMDVVCGETAGVVGQLLLLYPLLFILQGFQGYIGILLLWTAFIDDDSEWQMSVCGMLLLIMALGNFTNTLETVAAKMKIKTTMKSKQFHQRPASVAWSSKSFF